MTRLYSDKDKATAVRNFIYARSNGQAEISDFSEIADYMEKGWVTLLHPISKSGKYETYTTTEWYYNQKDAETYFEWLISVVAGTEDKTVSEEVFKKAVNQLFMFLFGISGTLASKVELLTPYSLDEQLIEFDKKVDRMNEQIVEALERIMAWQQKYQPYLDRLAKEQESIENALDRKAKDKE